MELAARCGRSSMGAMPNGEVKLFLLIGSFSLQHGNYI